MIEPDINQQMARFAPSQNPTDPGFDAIEKAVAGMSGVPMPAPEPVNMDIDRAVQDIAAQRKQDMASSLMAASEVNPDEAAQADVLGKRFGVGQDIALRNMAEMRRQAMVQDTERMDLLRKDPVLARYIADREFAAQASDDVGVLSMLRPLVLEAAMLQTQGGLFRVVGAGYERGAIVSERGDIGAKAMAGFAEPGDFDRAKELTQRMQALGQQGLVGSAAEMIAQNVSQLRTIGTATVGGAALGSLAGPAGTVAGGALGATAGVMAGTGTMEAGNLYLDMREQGVSDDAAIPAAVAGGFLNGLIEVVGMKIAAAPFKAFASKVIREEVSKAIAQPTMRSALIAAGKAYGLQVGGEASEEGLQEIVAIASEEIAKAADGIDSETSLRDATGRVIEAFAYGGMASALLGGIGPGANLVVDLRRASATQRQQEFFNGLAENRKESKLAQRNPQGYERFLAAQAQDTPAETIYVDAAIARKVLAQSGTTTAQLDELLPGIRERLEQAAETGGDVTIPTSQFGARLANTELGNALLPHMRLSPDAMSATEAQAFEAERQAVVEEARTILAAKQEADAAFVAEAQQVEDEAFEQVRAVGQFTDIEARTIAKLRQAMVVVDAAEAGMTPAQYQRERGVPLQVRGEGMAVPVAPSQAVAPLTATETNPLQTALGELSARIEEQNAKVANEKLESSNPIAKAVAGIKDSVRRLTDAINANNEVEIANQAWRLRNRLNNNRQNLDANTLAAVEGMLAKLDAFMQQRGIEIDDPIGQDTDDNLVTHKVVSWLPAANGEVGTVGGGGTITQVIQPGIQRVQGNKSEVLQRGEVVATAHTAAETAQRESANAQRKAEIRAKLEAKFAPGETSAAQEAQGPLEQAAISRMDADYLAAVERGDMEAAKRMVDEAAKAAGYNVGPVYHATPNRFGEFSYEDRPNEPTGDKSGFFFYRDKSDAENWASSLRWIDENSNPIVVAAYLRMTNTRQGVRVDGKQGAAARGEMIAAGYDSATHLGGKELVVFYPEQIKSADPVTYDEQGNIVPLSRRFDITSPKLFEQAAAGPARGGFDPRTLNVLVGKGGDVSTLSHELIHLRIAEYLRMARSATPPARVIQDLDTLFVFMGVEGSTFQERLDNYERMTIEQRRPLEEKATYNFEIYLYEGKAPSVELRGVFDRLAAWMRRVYKSIRDDLNAIYRREFGTDLPILTPEVRSVFDRMLASEEQIKRQEAISGMKGLFQTQAESGMGDAEWAAYQAMQQEATDAAVTDLNTASMRQLQWLGNARARILRDLQKKHEAKRKEVTAEVAAAVKVEPVYRAMTYLRYGRFVDTDGAEVEVEGAHRLDIEKVRAMYAGMPSAESVEPIRATGMAVPANVRPDITPLGTGKYGMLGRDGLDPDVVAEMFGYGSGDEMVRALLAAKPMKEAVAERTDAEMLRRFGDMNTPAALEAEVQKALHNEARARFVAVELRHIAKAQTPVRVMLEAAKQVAADMIADTTIRNLRPNDFVAAEARAARDAEYLVKYEAQPRIRGRAEYDRVRLAALAAGSTEEDANIAAAAAQEAFIASQTETRSQEFRERFGPTTPQEALIRAKRAQLYQNQLAAEALRVKEYVDKQVKYLRRVLRDENVKRMGADAANQVRSILDNYSLVSMTRAQREQVTDLRTWLAAEEANGMMVDIDPSLADSARRRNYTELTVSQFRDLVESVKLIEYRGKNERNIYLAGQKAVFEEKRDEIVASMTEVAEKKGRNVRKYLGDEDRKWMNSIASYDASQQTIGNIVYVLDGGKRDGPLAKYLLIPSNDAGNQEATDRAAVSEKVNDIVGPLAKKGQFVAPKMYFPNINESLSLEQRMVVALNYGNQSNIDRLLNGEQWTEEQARVIIESLTDEQLQAVQSIWDVMSSFRDRVAEKSRRLTGKEPRWLEPLPMRVTSADGNIVELRGGYYPAKYNPRRSVGARELDIAGDAERLQRDAYTATTTSRSFEKNRSDRPPVDQVLSRQFVAMYSGLNEVIHDLAWHDFAIAATKLLRDKSFQRVIKERYGLETYNAIKDWVDVVVAGDRTKYDSFEQIAIFARQNVSVAAMGIRLLTAAVQPTGIFPAMTRTGIGPMVRAIVMFGYSPVETSSNVVSRSSFMQSRGRTRFRDLNEIANIVQEQSRIQRIRRGYISSAYVLTSFMQGLVDTSVWMAAYSNAIKAGKSEKESVFVADQTVIDTQGSGRVQDLSSAMRGGKKQSAYAKLFTPFYQYSNTMYSLFGAQMRTAPSYGKAAKDAFLILTVGAIVEELIRYALRPSPEDEEPEDFIKKLAANQIDFVVGLPFGIREFRGAGSLIVGTEDGVQSYRGPSGLRIVTDANQAIVQARQGEFDAAFRRSMINLLGTTVGIPSAQINSTIDGIEALVEGEVTGPTAIVAPLTGVQR
jgi:hypothetical protein